MKTSHQEVIESTSNWLQQGHSVWLATVTRTWGSSPRPAGSLMACVPTQGLVGSLSGGCIEEDLLLQFSEGNLEKEYQQNRQPRLLLFGKNDEERERLKLPCSGSLEVLLEYVSPDMTSQKHFNALRNALQLRQNIARRVDLQTGFFCLRSTDVSSDFIVTDRFVEQCFQAEWQMLLTGIGEVTRCVAQLAIATGFSVTVCDFRPAFIEHCSIEGVAVLEAFPDDLIQQTFHDSKTAIIALAHDPRVDDMALMAALTSDAFYVGAMGSKRTSLARRQRLETLELTPEQINPLHAPAGLPIGSKTPWEIAISIMAEVTSAKNQTLYREKQSREKLSQKETASLPELITINV